MFVLASMGFYVYLCSIKKLKNVKPFKTDAIMKRLFTLFAVALSLVMVSCDEDVEEAIRLSGQWKGDMGMCYEDHGWIFYAEYTDIVFYPDYEYATHGYGKQVDHYYDGPVKKTYLYFDWNIKDGRIYMRYYDEHQLSNVIYDYRLGYDSFIGYMGNTRFQLYKIADYYDWGYYDDYGYYNEWYYDDYSYPYDYPYYYYGKSTRSGSNEAKDAEISKDEKPRIHIMNRFMEGLEKK